MRRVLAQVLAVTDTSGASNQYDTHNLRKTNIQLPYCCTPLAPSAVNQNGENFRLQPKTTTLSRKCTILHYISMSSELPDTHSSRVVLERLVALCLVTYVLRHVLKQKAVALCITTCFWFLN
jgi:hypothetical protein